MSLQEIAMLMAVSCLSPVITHTYTPAPFQWCLWYSFSVHQVSHTSVAVAQLLLQLSQARMSLFPRASAADEQRV